MGREVNMINENETKVLVAIAQEIQNCTAGEFGYVSDIGEIEGIEKRQISGYTSQLVQKDLISIDEEFGSAQMLEAGVKAVRAAGYFEGNQFAIVDGDEWV